MIEANKQHYVSASTPSARPKKPTGEGNESRTMFAEVSRGCCGGAAENMFTQSGLLICYRTRIYSKCYAMNEHKKNVLISFYASPQM